MRPTFSAMKTLDRQLARHKSISFIGLGRMGYEMAFNLFSKTFAAEQDAHFVVCDAMQATSHKFHANFLAQFPGAQITIAETPEQAVLASKTVITMLPSSPHVQTVYTEEAGIVPAIKNLSESDAKETFCIDSTTLDVTVARNVAKDVVSTGASMVDAPVSGGAKAATLSFLVGGTDEAFKSAHPVLSHMGKRIIHCGAFGSGLGAKICNNVRVLYRYSALIAVAEGMLLGQRLGLDPAVLAGVINSSTGGCWASSVNNPVPHALPGQSPPCERDFEGGFATALMLKDMGLATALASNQGSPLPLGEATEEFYAKVVREAPELARKDFSSVYKYLAECTSTPTLLSAIEENFDSTSKPVSVPKKLNEPSCVNLVLLSLIDPGGLNTYARALAAYLVPVEGEALVSHMRVVDKYSVHPPTTYIGSEFPKVLEKPGVEYQQRNLTVDAAVASAFDPPEGQAAYDYVFDCTGEVRVDRTEVIQIKTTCNIARLIGLEAAKRKVKAYVRLQLPFYETSSKNPSDEKQDVKPVGTVGTWWHETLRILAAIPDLNLVILRCAFGYGPYTDFGSITSVMTVASVYGYMKKPMKSLWSPGKNPTNTIHVEDIAGGMWSCASWIAPLGREKANSLAGETIPFHNEKAKVIGVEGMASPDANLTAPLFNLADDSDSTLVSVGETVTSFFGTTFEFFNFLQSAAAKFKLEEMVEDINEHHVGGWTEMITQAKPPCPNTPLSAYMDHYALQKHTLSFDNSKIKTIVGYTLRHPQFNHDVVKDTIDKWKEEGSWPCL
ncbi:hypothetical protein ONZ45_g3222 [Pleurotus djamor]|nr:hypothetical protein ONZ45_g3222 [Pleurotus djamor]